MTCKYFTVDLNLTSNFRLMIFFLHVLAGPIGEDIILENFLDLALFELLDVPTSDILRCQLLQTLSIVCAGKPRVLSRYSLPFNYET